MRTSTRGKGHEEGGLTYAKVGSSLRSLPGNSRASTPKTRVCLLYCFVLVPTPLTLRALTPPPLSEKQLITAPVNKVAGRDRSVSTYKLL